MLTVIFIFSEFKKSIKSKKENFLSVKNNQDTSQLFNLLNNSKLINSFNFASLFFIARYSLTGFENANALSTCSSLKTDIPNSVKITEYMNS